MQTTTSADGTVIAYDRAGSGAPIIFVPAALNSREAFNDLAAELKSDFTTVQYDRRGRGTSTDAIAAAEVDAYAIEREVEDLASVIAAVGGRPTLFGFSSGAVLALAATASGLPIGRLALYEPPLCRDDASKPDLRDRLAEMIKNGQPGVAVATYQIEAIGLLPEMVSQIKHLPLWPGLEAIAQTTVYDATLTADPEPTAAMRSVSQPTLVIAGTQTWPKLAAWAKDTAAAIAAARYVEVEGGANHTIPPMSTAAVHDGVGLAEATPIDG